MSLNVFGFDVAFLSGNFAQFRVMIALLGNAFEDLYGVEACHTPRAGRPVRVFDRSAVMWLPTGKLATTSDWKQLDKI
ncbi:hypothetical protein ABIB82_007371 [Bradyrhizobium sp. i1.8.4]|uniref:hypothetical protein n=1 Tax=unclassified Bradyrhizobium TaxID=2631580 RepID=UPI003D1FBC30